VTVPTSELDAAEYGARVAAVRVRMRERGIRVLCLAGPENIYYLTGLSHQGYFAFTFLVVPTEGDVLLVARAMEHATVAAQTIGCRHVPFDDGSDPSEAAAACVREALAGGTDGGVAVELTSMYLPVAIWSEIRDRLPEFTLTDGSGVVEGVRSVLSPAEVGFVRQAARLSDRGMQAGIEAVHDGVNEQAVVAAIYAAMIGAGSEQPGFVPLVRTRDVLLQEHIIWRDHVVQTGDALFLELSASVARYHAPLSRMVYLAEPPSGTGVAADIALAALEAVRATLRDGALAADAYAAWQQVVDDGLGHDRYRRHHCGYLTGIGFPPSWTGGGTPIGLRPGNDLVLRSGMVFHVLSWLIGQEPADFVVSDTVLVTETGGELLTTTDRGPLRA